MTLQRAPARAPRRALRPWLAAAASLSALGCAWAAQAQEAGAEPAKVDEVVVTAQRRSERLQDVPAAVTAVSAQALQNAQAATLGDLQSFAPNLTLHEGDASNAVVYIRGVGQIDSLAFADPGVGIYVDDVYLGRAQGAFLDVYDVDRIEVLRGPQGALYGRNTIGGAVKFVSTPLTNDFGGRAEVAGGDYGQIQAKASVNVPIVEDRLLAKAAFDVTRRDGYATNAHTGQDEGDKRLTAGRLALEWRASEDLTFRLNLDGSRDDPKTSRTPARATPVFGYPATRNDPFRVDANFDGLNETKTGGVSLVADWRISDTLSAKSISAYRRMSYKADLDLDATPASIFGVYDRENQNQLSQELQLTYAAERLHAVGGLFFFHETDRTFSGLLGPDIALVTGSVNDQKTNSYAAYGQGTYDLTERVSLTAGLRYTREYKHFARTQKFFDPSTPFPIVYSGPGLLVTDFATKADWSSLSPKVGVDVHVTPDVLAYATASRGFKSGGFDGRANDAAGAAPYRPETLWAYEAGLKSSLMDHRLVANLALFWNDYKDLQLSSFVADQNGSFAALFTNAGKATMRGVELELSARPTPDLTLNANVGYLDAHYDEYIGPGGVDISNQRHLVNAPKWDGRIGGTYRFDVGPRGAVIVGADLAYRSKTYPTVSSSEVLAQDGYGLVSAFVRYEHDEGRWWAQLGGKNLTDRRYIEHGFDLSDSLGYQLAYYGDPRTWTFTLGARF